MEHMTSVVEVTDRALLNQADPMLIFAKARWANTPITVYKLSGWENNGGAWASAQRWDNGQIKGVWAPTLPTTHPFGAIMAVGYHVKAQNMRSGVLRIMPLPTYEGAVSFNDRMSYITDPVLPPDVLEVWPDSGGNIDITFRPPLPEAFDLAFSSAVGGNGTLQQAQTVFSAGLAYDFPGIVIASRRVETPEGAPVATPYLSVGVGAWVQYEVPTELGKYSSRRHKVTVANPGEKTKNAQNAAAGVAIAAGTKVGQGVSWVQKPRSVKGSGRTLVMV